MAEKKYLRRQVGLGAAADDEEEIEEQAEKAVDHGQEHDLASSLARPLAQIRLPIGVFAPHTCEPADVVPLPTGPVERRDRLGGIIHECSRAA